MISMNISTAGIASTAASDVLGPSRVLESRCRALVGHVLIQRLGYKLSKVAKCLGLGYCKPAAWLKIKN